MAKQSTTRATTTAPAAPVVPSSGAPTTSAEIRIIVAVNDAETTEYTVVPMGGGDKAGGFNVTPAHDPNGGMVLEKAAETPDAAIQDFSSRFDKDMVTVSGGGACYVVVWEEKVLACEKDRPAAVEAAAKLAEVDGEGVGGVSGSVHPATSAVKATFEAVGTEGTRIIVNKGGLVSMAR